MKLPCVNSMHVAMEITRDHCVCFSAILHDDPGNIKALVGRGSAKAMDKDIKGVNY